jgi:hypothetical protein
MDCDSLMGPHNYAFMIVLKRSLGRKKIVAHLKVSK